MSSRTRKLALIIFALTGLTLLCLGLWLQSFVTTAVLPSKPQVIEIKPGSSFARIAAQLQTAGVVSDVRRFTLLARWRKVTGQIHAGEYLFAVSATPEQVLDRLVAGDIRKFQITIPEGFNLREIADRLATTGVASAEEFFTLCNDEAFIKKLGVEATSLEGYLFPETYSYSSSTTPRQLLRAMVEQLDAQITAKLLENAAALNLDRHQLITLASIVQKEAGNLMEMPLISSVFHNRLKLGMPLQADPTVIYGVADFDGNLTRKHLNTPTPYNTYRMRGLPPGPIACPGEFALHATAHPAESKNLYFVARGDGSHKFSATLKEHNRAVRRYQLGRH